MAREVNVRVLWPGADEVMLIIELHEAKTVADLKMLIEREEEDFPASEIELVYNSREIFDDEVLAELELRSVTCTRRTDAPRADKPADGVEGDLL